MLLVSAAEAVLKARLPVKHRELYEYTVILTMRAIQKSMCCLCGQACCFVCLEPCAPCLLGFCSEHRARVCTAAAKEYGYIFSCACASRMHRVVPYSKRRGANMPARERVVALLLCALATVSIIAPVNAYVEPALRAPKPPRFPASWEVRAACARRRMRSRAVW
jgi:hypothetical protein